MQKEFINIIKNKNELTEEQKSNRIKLLLDNGVNPNFEIKNPIANKIPLFECVLWRDLELLKILLTYNSNNKADPNIVRHDIRGYEGILMLICNLNGNFGFNMMKLLLENGTNPNIYRHNYNGLSFSPLDFLCWHNKDYKKIKLLVEYGAKITLDNLISAIKYNNFKIVKILLDGGADPYEKDKVGKDAFDYAKTEEMMFLLNKNKFFINWIKTMQQESEEGIIFAIKYKPENFHVWKDELELTNSLLKYW